MHVDSGSLYIPLAGYKCAARPKRDLSPAKTIAGHYGLAHQIMKLREELQELHEAARDFVDVGCPTDRDTHEQGHLLEELADVELMVDQIKYLLDADGIVANIRNCKEARQIKRILEERKAEKEGKNK